VAGTALFSVNGQLPHGETEVDGVFMHRHILFKWYMPLDILFVLKGLQLACCRLLIRSASKRRSFSWSFAYCRSLESTFS